MPQALVLLLLAVGTRLLNCGTAGLPLLALVSTSNQVTIAAFHPEQ